MDHYEELTLKIVEKTLGSKMARIERFPTGLSHYVYDVASEDGLSCVIRIARPERSSEFRRGIKWHKIIERVDVRLPEIIEMGVIDSHDFTVYERLPGDDIENVYSSLSNQEKKSLAEEVAEIQRRISLVDQQHFERILHWKDYLLEIVARSEREILSHGLCNPKFVGLVRKEINTEAGYFNEIRPVAFLYDLSVRNVMVLKGKVTGIIDVDDVWLGDPLLAIGRGKTILLAMGQDAEFINHWCEFIELSTLEKEMLEIYSLLYCLRFMGSIGTELNGNKSIQTNPENARLFERMAEGILRERKNMH